ncbi:MAG: TAXI family TRAP transporter solute-binding subunit [Alphaproteobacteria bacterium]|jgi:TRAP transporter TAXI family solute receptor|nr:TAXI family TRAP transporter solute-binding subunit [Alphaproteobacteria bacterium]MBP9877545.1 TAXI family TRAP transporter solute-binding subunit [Alphaproteobacteria bacterium]
MRDMHPMKHPFFSRITLAFLSIFVMSPIMTTAEDLQFFRIGTGPNQGTYFEMGTELAKRISHPPGTDPCTKDDTCGIPGLIAIAQTTSGSDENIRSVNKGSLQAAFVQENLAYLAFHHEGPYKNSPETYQNIRSVIHLAQESVQIIVKAKSGFEKIEDLKGKKIAIGLKGSGTAIDAFTILKAYGLNKKDFSPIYMAPSQSAEALIHEEIDAIFLIGHTPSTILIHLSDQIPIKLLNADDHQIHRALEKLTFFKKGLIKAGTYTNTQAVQTISSDAVLIVHKDIDPDLIRQILTLLGDLNGQKKLKRLHIDETKKSLKESIPLHSGAEQFYHKKE